MSFKKQAAKFIAETIVGNVLSSAGQKIGEAVGEVIGRKINPVPIPEDKDKKPDEAAK